MSGSNTWCKRYAAWQCWFGSSASERLRYKLRFQRWTNCLGLFSVIDLTEFARLKDLSSNNTNLSFLLLLAYNVDNTRGAILWWTTLMWLYGWSYVFLTNGPLTGHFACRNHGKMIQTVRRLFRGTELSGSSNLKQKQFNNFFICLSCNKNFHSFSSSLTNQT